MTDEKNKSPDPKAACEARGCALMHEVLQSEARLEEALEESFPASDPAASNRFD